MTTATYQPVPLKDLHESPLNPRKTFSPTALAELTASVAAKGVITPLLVRPNNKGYEIAAGHRRYRAATAAQLVEVPCVVRAMDDTDFLEILIMENDEREDLHPLEEAEGYRTLITKASYSVERIAERKGCSEKYIYDRVKLLELIDPLKKVFREDKITAGHAVLLARLKPKEQELAMHSTRGGLWQHEYTLLDPDDRNGSGQLKAKSVRELEAWIAEHVRFKPTEADPVLFPETTTTVQAAIAEKEKIVEITHESFIQEEARAGGEKTIRAGFWERADGKKGSKECDRAVTGVVVVGHGRGDAFKVCVDRERCVVHWKKEIDAKKKAAARPKPKAAAKKPAVDDWKVQQAKRDAAQRRGEAALPAIFKELAVKIVKAPATARGTLGKLLLDRLDGDAAKYLKAPATADDLVRFLVFDQLSDRPDTWNGLQNLARNLKPFGVDVKKHLADVDAKAKADDKAKKK